MDREYLQDRDGKCVEVHIMRTNFQFQNQNITMVKGDTLAFNVEIMDESGEPVIVDGA